MTEYRSCFIGIPLPEKYTGEFEKLLADVRQIDPWLKLTGFNPHITLHYLSRRSESDLEELKNIIEPIVPIIRGTSVKVGGYDNFQNKVFFLPAKSPNLNQFHETLINKLGQGKNLPFHPHLTVCEEPTRQLSDETLKQLSSRFNLIDWSFPIENIMVFGSNWQLKDITRADMQMWNS